MPSSPSAADSNIPPPPEDRTGPRRPPDPGCRSVKGTGSTNSGYTDESGERGELELDCCCCSFSPSRLRLGEFDGPGRNVGQAQVSLFLAHPAQTGLASLHFFLRRRQVKQPVLTRLMGSACARLMGGIRG